jgi:hypothetical protein
MSSEEGSRSWFARVLKITSQEKGPGDAGPFNFVTGMVTYVRWSLV